MIIKSLSVFLHTKWSEMRNSLIHSIVSDALSRIMGGVIMTY